MQLLTDWDKALFKMINSQWHAGFFDSVLPYLRIAEFWWPLYFFLLLFATINFKKNGWIWVLFAAITVIACNFISSDIIKENIFRLRPCNDPAMADWIRVVHVKYRPQSSSFTSSHATNHFGFAMFFYSTLKNVLGKWTALFFLWAGVISYTQIYVGVHYPLDVICGAILGSAIGYLTATLFNKQFGLR
jgi:membrane-associated phospholipid phosphatase